MKILSAEQVKAADLFTIENEPISSIDLMERAAGQCVLWLRNKYPNPIKYAIFCGHGNNGGDGLAIARQLHQLGEEVVIYLDKNRQDHSPDFAVNLKRATENGLQIENFPKDIIPDAIVIDALFGLGLSRPIEGKIAEVIELVNKSPHEVVSIDLPSGLAADIPLDGPVVNADFTLTFQQPKLNLLLPTYGKYTGEIHILDIGLHPNFISNVQSQHYYTNIQEAKKLYLKRSKFAHKGSFGHALIIAGSKGKMGAAVLCTKACLKSGAGLVSTHCPTEGLAILQTTVPEAMVLCNPGKEFIEPFEGLPSDYGAMAIGPGLGQADVTAAFLKTFVTKYADTPIVIDADALNILSNNKDLIPLLRPSSILTPHPKEFERLVGPYSSENEKLDKLRNLAVSQKLIVVLKGAHTCIALPKGELHFNSTGNPGMATAGSGDVLTGIICGLLAQGYPAENAAIFGAYLHGSAGDLAAERHGMESMIASEIIEHLGKAYQLLT